MTPIWLVSEKDKQHQLTYKSFKGVGGLYSKLLPLQAFLGKKLRKHPSPLPK